MTDPGDRIRPGRLLLLGGLLAVVFLLLVVLLVAKVGPSVWAAIREMVGALGPALAG